MKFVDLHAHTTFSTGDGYGTPKQHVQRLKDLGRSHGCFTEHGNVSSWVALEQQCEKADLEPIFGIEIYVGVAGERRKTHMILIAMNAIGMQNINRIVTKSYQQFYQFPTVYWEDLVHWNEGIIALSGCADSALSCILLGGKYFGDKTLECSDRNFQRAVRGVRRFAKVFGDRYYLEVQRFPGLERTCALNPLLAEISRHTGVSLVATSDVHYPLPDQNAMQRILHASHRGGTVETADAEWEYSILLTYPQSDEEIVKDLEATGLSKPDATWAVFSTKLIAERCTGVRLPKAPLPKYVFDCADSDAAQALGTVDFGAEDLLRHRITQGWNERLKYNDQIRKRKSEYKERIKHEYETICARAGFADYFLIVADLVTWAKGQGIAVGPGRGSSAGSLVCYLLHITEIDSLQFPMLFERFLDPTRSDPPDIDIDFEDERRDEVFDYAASKYGKDRVANIGTFTRYLGRNSLDDIARVYHIAGWKVDAIKGKLIDRAEGHPRFSKTLQDTYDSFSDIREILDEQPELHYAPQLEGNIRTFGVHAAGMVISSQSLDNICATYERKIGGQRGGTGSRSGSSSARGSGRQGQSRERIGRAIPFDKRDAAYLGLLKIDALSLITMGEISTICKLAGMSLEELYRIPLDDKETLAAFRKGDVMGIFQFEGNTTRRILKSVAPTTFMHLSDVNALSRPGADDKAYVLNKASGQAAYEEEYVHPIMAQHLSWTYGVIVYEEQILYVLRDLGGFEPSELNRMRKIIHDKLGSTVFNEYYQRFVKGAAAHGLSEDAAKSVWDGMVSASGYAFNIAHSVSYAHIGYWSQWLKIHHPAPFFTAKLTRCGDDVRRGKLIAEAERHGIDVFPPRLLESGHDWTLTHEFGKPMILAGLGAIPGIGPKTIENIIDWRLEQQSLNGVDDFFPEWDDLLEVSGIGPGKIKAIKTFCESDDPFGVEKTTKILQRLRNSFGAGEFAGIPTPTHISIDVPPEPEVVCYMGIVRARKYYDAVEQLQKRTAEELSYEDALSRLEDSHLLKYVALDVEDEYGETIRVRVSRWKYPTLAKQIQSIKLNRDVVVVQGKSSDFGGISIQTKQLTVIDPERYEYGKTQGV